MIKFFRTVGLVIITALGAVLMAANAEGLTFSVTDLGTLGGDYSAARSINDAGQVTGTSRPSEGDSHAFLWDAYQGMQDLGVLGSPQRGVGD